LIPWEQLDEDVAPDGERLVLRRRGAEYLIVAGGYDLMSSEDEGSSRALANLGCLHLSPSKPARVLVGGLGMGYTLRAALDATGPKVTVEVAELVSAVVRWNQGVLGDLAGRPLDDPRCELHLGDVFARISAAANASSAEARYDAILLDVDNGPEFLAHRGNGKLYDESGLREARAALRSGGVLGVWSFSDDKRFTERLSRAGFAAELRKVEGSRKGRGRHHVIWLGTKTKGGAKRRGGAKRGGSGPPPRRR
jgi:spermidine synthase